jgi:hypothetical protein
MYTSTIIESVIDCGLKSLCDEDIKNIEKDLRGAFVFALQDQQFITLFETLLKKARTHIAKTDPQCGQPHTPATHLDDRIALALHNLKKAKEQRYDLMLKI